MLCRVYVLLCVVVAVLFAVEMCRGDSGGLWRDVGTYTDMVAVVD